MDELVRAQRLAVRRWLRSLLSEYPQVQVVVTSRPGAADRSWLAAENFAPVLLERMSPLDVAAFCRRWHDAMRDAAGRCAVELPCRVEELPDYERALLLERRDAEREVPASRTVVLDTGNKLAILQDVLQHLLERSGVIREPVLGRVDFVHHTFQEYLAAKEVVEDQTTETLVTRAHLDQWWETLVMAVGHTAKPHDEGVRSDSVSDMSADQAKHAIRERVWTLLEHEGAVAPGVRGRIPAFDGRVPEPAGRGGAGRGTRVFARHC